MTRQGADKSEIPEVDKLYFIIKATCGGATILKEDGSGKYKWIPNDRPEPNYLKGEYDKRMPTRTKICTTYSRSGRISGWYWEIEQKEDKREKIRQIMTQAILDVDSLMGEE